MDSVANWTHPTGESPNVVDLVCLGETSRSDYVVYQLEKGRTLPSADEVWTLNRGIRIYASDCAFVLDEIEAEMAADPEYGNAIEDYLCSGRPIITTRSPGDDALHPQFQMKVFTYPAQAVLQYFALDPMKSDPYWHNSVPMIIAYAAAIGVARLRVWGADYTMPDGRVLESDRANCEFWIGRALQRGMSVELPPNTTLCNRRALGGKLKVYGLLCQNEDALRSFLTQGPQRTVHDGRDAAVEDEELSFVERVANLQSHDFDGGTGLTSRFCLVCGTATDRANSVDCAAAL